MSSEKPSSKERKHKLDDQEVSPKKQRKDDKMADLDGIILGMCNPLLDISANVTDDFLKKYDIKLANASLAEDKHLPLFEEMKKLYHVDYIAGGAGQNSVRAAQWLLQTPGATSYIGAIGDDENGKLLREKAESAGVRTLYGIDKTKPTGLCAVLVKDKERALVATLSAANSYKKETHFDRPDVQAALQKAKLIYCTGFFVSYETSLACAKHALQYNKTFLFNLSATFIIEIKWNQLNELIPYMDFIFGNEDEWTAFGKKIGWGPDFKEIAKKASELPKHNAQRHRVIVITQGARNTIVYTNGTLKEYTPIKVPPEKIVDTNGAGDSFVGGFLAGLALQKSLDECVRAAHYVASECIQKSGATWPDKPNFTFQS